MTIAFAQQKKEHLSSYISRNISRCAFVCYDIRPLCECSHEVIIIINICRPCMERNREHHRRKISRSSGSIEQISRSRDPRGTSRDLGRSSGSIKKVSTSREHYRMKISRSSGSIKKISRDIYLTRSRDIASSKDVSKHV